jgi:predicted RecA/RadA family phage recombinase
VPNEYRAAIDVKNHGLRPRQTEEHLRLIYDSDNSTNVIKRGDNVYIKYDQEEYIDQTTASSAIKINPFAVTIYDGTITLSPASDEWRDVKRIPDKIIPGGRLLSHVPSSYFDGHVHDWCGNEGKDAVKRVVTDESILTLINDRVIETVLLNFMRARKVFFKADGLRPNTRVFTFLDGENISSLTNGGSGHNSFQNYSDTDSDFGNTLVDITEHPDGSSTLVTDGDGRVSGSFIVPNNSTTKIRTGTRQFKILDISVDNEQNAGNIAATPYTANGFLDTKRAEYVSTRVVLHQGPMQYEENDGGFEGGLGGGTTLHELGGSVQQYNDNKNQMAGISIDPNNIVENVEFGFNHSIEDLTGLGMPQQGVGNSIALSADTLVMNHINEIQTYGPPSPSPSNFNSGKNIDVSWIQDEEGSRGITDNTGLGTSLGGSEYYT